MEEKIANIIYGWVNNNFGETEVEDPSWNIEALAKEIAKHGFEFYSYIKNENDIEDIKLEAKNMELKLTDKEIEWVLYRYNKLDDYKLEDLRDILKDLKERR